MSRYQVISSNNHFEQTIALSKSLKSSFFFQFFTNWFDDDSIWNFSRFNSLKVCWIICLNRSALCDRMRISTSNFSNDQNIVKSEINMNDLNVLLETTKVFDVVTKWILLFLCYSCGFYTELIFHSKVSYILQLS